MFAAVEKPLSSRVKRSLNKQRHVQPVHKKVALGICGKIDFNKYKFYIVATPNDNVLGESHG
jgi:hypothetical protein